MLKDYSAIDCEDERGLGRRQRKIALIHFAAISPLINKLEAGYWHVPKTCVHRVVDSG